MRFVASACTAVMHVNSGRSVTKFWELISPFKCTRMRFCGLSMYSRDACGVCLYNQTMYAMTAKYSHVTFAFGFYSCTIPRYLVSASTVM